MQGCPLRIFTPITDLREQLHGTVSFSLEVCTCNNKWQLVDQHILREDVLATKKMYAWPPERLLVRLGSAADFQNSFLARCRKLTLNHWRPYHWLRQQQWCIIRPCPQRAAAL